MKSVAQEGRKVKPIPPTTPSPFTDRKTSRTKLNRLKPAEDNFFSPFPLNSFFLSVLLSFSFLFLPSFTFLFLLPAFFYFFALIFLKISYLSSNLFKFHLPPFLSFSIPFFPPSLLLFSPLLSLFPTDETIKHIALKRVQLQHVTPISSRPVNTGE